jgi:photosystem II stability/assembly factor-like uncharacterized protein
MKNIYYLFITFYILIFPCYSQLPTPWLEVTSGVNTQLLCGTFDKSMSINRIVWIGGENGVVLRYSGLGSTPQNVGGVLIGNESVYSIAAFGSNNVVVTTTTSSGTKIFRTSNSGTSWAEVFSQSGGFGKGLVYKSTDSLFFLGDPVGGRWSLFRSIDGGITWDSTGMNLPAATGEASYNNSIFMRGNKIWFGTNSARIWFSSDFGNTWSALSTGGQSMIYSLYFVSDTEGMAGGTGLIRTFDGGNTWSSISAPGSGIVNGIVGSEIFTTYGYNYWAFTRNGSNSIYSTWNNAQRWDTIYSAPSGNYNHLFTDDYSIYGARNNGCITAGSFSILPVELISFKIEEINSGVILSWSTCSELNNKGFEVQKRLGNNEFKSIGFINGRGTSTVRVDYHFEDQDLSPDIYTYRLRQIDYDGRSEYSKEIEIDMNRPAEFSLSQNFPNPFNPETVIKFSIHEKSNVILTVYDISGQKVADLVNEEMAVGIYEKRFNGTSLPSGIYIFQLNAQPSEKEIPNYFKIIKALLLK